MTIGDTYETIKVIKNRDTLIVLKVLKLFTDSAAIYCGNPRWVPTGTYDVSIYKYGSINDSYPSEDTVFMDVNESFKDLLCEYVEANLEFNFFMSLLKEYKELQRA
jgi:hypothetical protein